MNIIRKSVINMIIRISNYEHNELDSNRVSLATGFLTPTSEMAWIYIHMVRNSNWE